jgi:hypothetical protein
MSDESLLTIDQAAEYLSVSPAYVWDHSARRVPREPIIPVVKIKAPGQRRATLRYRRDHLRQFVELYSEGNV